MKEDKEDSTHLFWLTLYVNRPNTNQTQVCGFPKDAPNHDYMAQPLADLFHKLPSSGCLPDIEAYLLLFYNQEGL